MEYEFMSITHCINCWYVHFNNQFVLYMDGLLWNIEFLSITHYINRWYVIRLHSNKLKPKFHSNPPLN